jgi:hypothetical protein
VNEAPDRFVQAAPLIAGIRCSDGVLLLAAHTSEDEEPLLYYDSHHHHHQECTKFGAPEEGAPIAAADSAGTSSSPSSSSPFRDLPPRYGGPFRVNGVNPAPATVALATAGWRADGDADLLPKARALASRERSRYYFRLPPADSAGGGRGSRTGDVDVDDEDDDEECAMMGIVLAEDLSLYFARRAASESVRCHQRF